MTQKMEELILEQLFKLSDKVDKMQENMVTKEDAKNFATKDDLKNFATKDDLKNFATKDDLISLEKRIDEKFDQQTKEIAEVFQDTFNAISKAEKIAKEYTDAKIKAL